jgi:hypothetical protein
VIGRIGSERISLQGRDFSGFINPPHFRRRAVRSLNDAAEARFSFASCR